MAIFGPKPWVNPFGKISTFRLFELLVFIAQKGVFSFQNNIKDIFLAYIDKKKIEKWPFLDQKPWVNPFKKISIFPLFELLVLIAYKGVFSFQNNIKEIFLAYIHKKKSLKNGHFWTENYGLTPLKKFQFFHSLNFLFLQPRRAFFRFRIS